MTLDDCIKIDWVADGCGIRWDSSDNELIAAVAKHSGELPNVPNADDELLRSLKEHRGDLKRYRRKYEMQG